MGRLLPPPRRSTRVWAVALGLPFLLGVALLTLTPARVEQTMPNLLDLLLRAIQRLGWTSLDFTRLEVLANVAVFIPVGVLAFLLVPRRAWMLSLLVGPALSLGIETAQYLALPHRAATVSDVLANATGASIGVVLAIFCTLLAATPSSRPRTPTVEAS
ncbi:MULTISPECIES: VanZ family protein [Microbacterium]|uniref:VanZ like family protein n=1 Tax=Microbacterium paraoxydans TaxID=199592 RepID=A0A1H1PYW4_9MICO|nr:VanZ family protein [Microbacterium paraoxydans]SDS16306.1 VanZ like family protein [Microbacterium paraoxydans]